jgi:hypothetical protein
MKKIIIYTVFFIFSFVISAFAETSLKAEVDKTNLTTDDALTYKLSISSSEKNIPLPEPPKFEGFEITSQIQSSSMSLAVGGIETKLSYVFILVPLDTGKFKIEPSVVNIKDKSYASESFEIEVKPGKSSPKLKEKPSSPKNIPPQLNSEQPQINL